MGEQRFAIGGEEHHGKRRGILTAPEDSLERILKIRKTTTTINSQNFHVDSSNVSFAFGLRVFATFAFGLRAFANFCFGRLRLFAFGLRVSVSFAFGLRAFATLSLGFGRL